VSSRDDYNRSAQLTYEIVRDWDGERPLFAFPPREYALLADLRDIGDKLARNEGARQLVRLLITRCHAATGQAPTAMMLRVVLEELRFPIAWVSLSELGLAVGYSLACTWNRHGRVCTSRSPETRSADNMHAAAMASGWRVWKGRAGLGDDRLLPGEVLCPEHRHDPMTRREAAESPDQISLNQLRSAGLLSVKGEQNPQ
jgi:hypothetical protein